MPSRSTRVNICRLTLGLTALTLLPTASAAELLPYDVTAVDRFSGGMIHGRDAYEGMKRGDLDREPMREVAYVDDASRLPPVHVVYPSAPPPVYEVVVRPDPQPELFGEHRIFEQIRIDVAIARCIFQNVCTEEVKKIPGVYLGDEQTGDDAWQGRAEGGGMEVISEGPSATEAPAAQAMPATPAQDRPGRVFVEE